MKKPKCPDCYSTCSPDEFFEYWECSACKTVIEMSESEKEYYQRKINL